MTFKTKHLEVEADPHEFEFTLSNTALLVIDMQRDFVLPGGFGEALGNDVSQAQDAIEPTRDVVKLARETDMPVIFTREGHEPHMADCPPSKQNRGQNEVGIGDDGPMGRVLIRGEDGHGIIDSLEPHPDEIVLDKPGKGSFYATELNLILQNHGIENLIVTGVTTEVCIHSTIREANDRGYECLLLEDCVGSYFEEFQRVGIEMIKAQGGIFGWVANSKKFADAVESAIR